MFYTNHNAIGLNTTSFKQNYIHTFIDSFRMVLLLIVICLHCNYVISIHLIVLVWCNMKYIYHRAWQSSTNNGLMQTKRTFNVYAMDYFLFIPMYLIVSLAQASHMHWDGKVDWKCIICNQFISLLNIFALIFCVNLVTREWLWRHKGVAMHVTYKTMHRFYTMHDSPPPASELRLQISAL